MTRAAFVERFGGTFEHSPWVAELVYDHGLPSDADAIDGLYAAFCRTFRAAGSDRQMAVVLAHPDLAGRLALAGGLTADSSDEQRSAGLDQCSPDELKRFTELNSAYREKFGFPFIMAVRGRRRAEILAAFKHRLANDPRTEFETALQQIERIARLRLEALMS
jgi:OHCU decarboxylase